MADKVKMRKEHRSSKKKTRRTSSVFYYDCATSEKTSLIDDNAILPNRIEKKSNTSEENNSRASSSSTTSSSTSSSSSSFQYNYSVNSTIAADINSNVTADSASNWDFKNNVITKPLAVEDSGGGNYNCCNNDTNVVGGKDENKLSYVQKLRIKFEKLSLETTPSDNFFRKLSPKRRFSSGNKIFLWGNFQSDDNSNLINEVPSEEEVDEISDCEEAAEIKKTIEDNTESEATTPTNNVPEILINDFGESINAEINATDFTDHTDSEKVSGKKRKPLIRSNPRRKTDIICEARNLNCVILKSHSYNPGDLFDHHIEEISASSHSDGEDSELKKLQNEFTFSTKDFPPMIEELIRTEEKYVESLQDGIKNYGGAFDKIDLPEGLKGKKYILLGNVEQILEFHKTMFLPMLKRNRGDLVKMFDDFSNLIEDNQFYPYVLFIMNKRKSLRLSEQFQEYFKNLQTELNDKLGINSFLIKPIQRLQRYPLPLQEFYKKQFGDISYKSAIASCCKLEKKLRNFLLTVNESERINDIDDCFDLDVFYQGKFRKTDEFKVYDYSIRKWYISKVFFFDKCVVYTEMKDKRLLYRGCYPCEKIGFLPTSKQTKFTLYYDKRKQQECDFEAEPSIIETWTELLCTMVEAVALDEKQKCKEKYSSSNNSDIYRKPVSDLSFHNSSRISSDSGIESMAPIYSPIDEGCARTTWYDTM